MSYKGGSKFPASMTSGRTILISQYTYVKSSCSIETEYVNDGYDDCDGPMASRVKAAATREITESSAYFTSVSTGTSGGRSSPQPAPSPKRTQSPPPPLSPPLSKVPSPLSKVPSPLSKVPSPPQAPPPPPPFSKVPSPQPAPPPPPPFSKVPSPPPAPPPSPLPVQSPQRAQSSPPPPSTPPPETCQKVKLKIVKRQQIKLVKLRNAFGSDVACICCHMNWLLAGSSLARNYLPLKEETIFDYLKDGVLLCAMANALEPGTVDEKEVSVQPVKDPADVSPSRENVNLGLTSLKTLGVCMEISESQMDWEMICRSGTVVLIGVLLQVMRLATLGRMNLKHHEKLVYIFDDWQDKEKDEVLNVKNLSRETVLLHWINYQLRRSGQETQVKSLTSVDSLAYSQLLEVIAPKEKKGSLQPLKNIAAVKDQMQRAEMVVKNAKILGFSDAIMPEHIVDLGKLDADPAKCLRTTIINTAFLARTFDAYPNIEEPAETKKRLDPSTSQTLRKSCKRGASEETLMMWINSFGPGTPVVYLDTDLRSGIVLLQVWDSMIPGCVDWSKVEDGYNKMPRRKFVWLSNCVEVMECAKRHSIRVNCRSTDIATGEMTNTLALVFVMMLTHSKLQQLPRTPGGKPAPPKDDKALVQWFNKQAKTYGTGFQLKDIATDPSLKNTNALGYVAERVLSTDCKDCVICKSLTPPPAAAAASCGSDAKFKFSAVQSLAKDKLDDYSTITISLLRKGGVTVYTSKISSDTDAVVFRSLLQQLSSLDAADK